MPDPINKELFDLLACPLCKSELSYNKDQSGLFCLKCSSKYPIKDGIPILLPQEHQRT